MVCRLISVASFEQAMKEATVYANKIAEETTRRSRRSKSPVSHRSSRRRHKKKRC